MVSLILFVLAAAFKAVADTLAHHFDTSVFRNLNRKFWDGGDTTAPNYLPFTKYPLDGWHLSNSLFLASSMLASVLYTPLFNTWIDFAIIGTSFVIVFNTLYNKILR